MNRISGVTLDRVVDLSMMRDMIITQKEEVEELQYKAIDIFIVLITSISF